VHQPKTLPFAAWAKFLKEYSEMGGGIVHVTGGEPTCVKHFSNYLLETTRYDNISFHLNTNFYSSVMSNDLFPLIKRLKVSLDSASPEYFNNIVRRKNAFEVVTANLDRLHKEIELGNTDTVLSLTYTVTKENYRHIPEFLEMYEQRWPLFYATFFSSYKGTNPRFVLDADDTAHLFNAIVPKLDKITQAYGDSETYNLFHSSHEPRTFKIANRFPEVNATPCFLQLSEFVVDEEGDLSNCSHLFRDNAPSTGMNLKDGHLRDLFIAAKSVKHPVPMHSACRYGCNRKLTTFNSVVEVNMAKR
jgi:MoaA/NifB/PqqE/SkfB family radical SAM enzyme